MRKDNEITNVKTFLIVIWDCLRLKDEFFYNALAYIMVLQTIIVCIGIYNIIQRYL